jgi:2-iminobutanoate/2-iminopropanoate deaminase
VKVIETKSALFALGPYSQAVFENGFVYTSGQVPLDPKTGKLVTGGICEQTEQVIQNLKAVLTAAGSSLDCVVKTVCFLTDMKNFEAFNEIYPEFS